MNITSNKNIYKKKYNIIVVFYSKRILHWSFLIYKEKLEMGPIRQKFYGEQVNIKDIFYKCLIIKPCMYIILIYKEIINL